MVRVEVPRSFVGLAELVFGSWLFVATSCASSRPFEELALTNGQTIASLTHLADTVAILGYDPADCLPCGSPVAGWLRWAEGSDQRRSVLVLAREPTPSERRDLIPLRLRPAGQLAKPLDGTLPVVYYYVKGHRVDSALGRTAVRRLYQTRAVQPIADSAGSGPN